MRIVHSSCLVALLAACAAASAGASPVAAATRPSVESPVPAWLAPSGTSFRTSSLDERGIRRLASIGWRGGRFVTSAGVVSVRISAAYAADTGAAQRWADFFASLVHGSELGLLDAYIAPLGEVETICGGPGALGCYGANRLVSVGDSSGGIAPESVAAHEYGHHVAYNRVNPPWNAEAWGTKRWATDMGICSRTAAGTAFPGDEGGAYTLNPGEAFAETFRVLNETQAGLPLTWPIVDASFLPDAAALAATRDDVLQPWTPRAATILHGRFARGRRTWSFKLAAPLDGELSARLTAGAGGLDLLAADGRTVLAQGAWAVGGGKSVTYQVCGRRTFVIRLTRGGAGRAFTLRLSTP